jgi:hypothetical protein
LLDLFGTKAAHSNPTEERIAWILPGRTTTRAAERADRFASEQLTYDVIANDRDAIFNHEARKKCGAFGIRVARRRRMAGSIPSRPWRRSRPRLRLQDNGLLFSINAHMWTAIIPLLYNGTEAQRRNFARIAARSSVATRWRTKQRLRRL